MIKIFCAILFFILSNLTAQSVIITSIVAGNCPTGTTAPELVELYVDGTVDVTDLRLQFQLSFQSFWPVATGIGNGVITDDYLYVVNDFDAFDSEFPGIRTANNTIQSTILFSAGGGDKIRLIDTSNDNSVIDIYGLDGENGEEEPWNFNTSYVQRKFNKNPTSDFNLEDWDILPKSTLVFKGVCWEEDPLNKIISLQSFADETLSVSEFRIKASQVLIQNPIKLGELLPVTVDFETKDVDIYSLVGDLQGRSEIKDEKLNFRFPSSGVYFLKFNSKTNSSITKKLIVN